MSKPINEQKTWRTNIGLCLTSANGVKFEKILIEENRSKANYIETLVIRDIHQREKYRTSL